MNTVWSLLLIIGGPLVIPAGVALVGQWVDDNGPERVMERIARLQRRKRKPGRQYRVTWEPMMRAPITETVWANTAQGAVSEFPRYLTRGIEVVGSGERFPVVDGKVQLP